MTHEGRADPCPHDFNHRFGVFWAILGGAKLGHWDILSEKLTISYKDCAAR